MYEFSIILVSRDGNEKGETERQVYFLIFLANNVSIFGLIV